MVFKVLPWLSNCPAAVLQGLETKQSTSNRHSIRTRIRDVSLGQDLTFFSLFIQRRAFDELSSA